MERSLDARRECTEPQILWDLGGCPGGYQIIHLKHSQEALGICSKFAEGSSSKHCFYHTCTRMPARISSVMALVWTDSSGSSRSTAFLPKQLQGENHSLLPRPRCLIPLREVKFRHLVPGCFKMHGHSPMEVNPPVPVPYQSCFEVASGPDTRDF